jgi:sirohydrochlorin cobaltochelatase
MIGRGSYDPTANAEMAQFARLRWEAERTAWLEIAFTAMTEPLMDRAASVIEAMPFRRIVVQPHLLFAGELMDRVRALAAASQARTAAQSWSVVDHLGPHDLLVEAVVDRARAALKHNA